MATNLLIAYPQITVDATTVSGSATASTSRPLANCITGPRANLTELAADGTAFWVKFDLGADTSKTIDYLIVARAKIAQVMGSNRCLLQGSDDDSAWTDICGVDSTFQSLTLYGPRAEDAVFTATLANSDETLPATVSYRYWRFWITDASDPSRKWPFSKVYFGAWFDPGRDPEYPRTVRKEVVRSAGERESRYIYTFTWRGISDSKRNEFFTYLLKNKENPVFLYTDSYHDLLLEHRLLHCLVGEHSIEEETTNSSNITITFEELI